MTENTKVLVIDDDPIVLELVRQRLTTAGYDVRVREEALGTTQAVREERPDVVLLDVMMPALNGERIASLLRAGAGTRGVGVIFYSSKSESDLAALIEQTGALGAIHKGGDEADFLERFRELVARHVAG